MNPLNASQSTVGGLAWKRYSRQTPLRDVAPALNGRASLARVRPCRTGAASFMVARAGAAHAGGPRAQQAGKLETRALFAGSQGGTVAPAGGNTCAPRSVRLDLKAPSVPRPDRTTPDHLSHRHRCQWQGREGFREQAVHGSELTVRFRASGWPWILRLTLLAEES